MGHGLTLVPLRAGDLESHWREAAPHVDEIWKWYTVDIGSREDFESYFLSLVRENEAGKRMAFSIFREGSPDVPLGSTSFMALSQENARLEIGSTWLYPRHRGTDVNSACKILLLDFAFGDLGCARVELKTDSLNVTSRRAMEAIGATYEGTFRNHMRTASGRTRHSSWFAFYGEEWPEKREALLERLRAKARRNANIPQA